MEMKCAWSVEHEAKVREHYFRKCTKRLSDLLRYDREHGNRPSWISEDIWPKLNEYRASSEFQKKRTLTKEARASKKDGFIPTLGSISIGTHRRRFVTCLVFFFKV